jgi:RNA polymerase sigma-70 factor (ECF subfamily)
LNVDHTPSTADLDDVRASLAGDERAYERLVRRHEQTIAAQMWRFTRDPVVLDELVQEVFVQAYLSLRSYREKAPFIHWLRRVATHVGYRHWKGCERDRVRRERLLGEQGPPRLSPAPSPGEAAEHLFGLLGTLPPKERLVLTMLYFDGHDTAEIAVHLGWSRGQVKIRAHRARKKLRARLEAAGYGSSRHE